MRPVVRTPARRIGGCTAKRDVALGEGRRRHAGLCAHGGYLVGCHEPLRELELVLYPTTRIGPHVYVAAPGLAMVVVYVDADGLAWLPVRSSEDYSRTRRIVRLVAPDLLNGQCASARLGYVRPPWIAGDLLPSGLPLGLPPGASTFALSLWLVGAGNMLGPMSVMSAIAGAASSTAPTRSRSVNLLLSVNSLPLV
jgi:hypothetical protein